MTDAGDDQPMVDRPREQNSHDIERAVITEIVRAHRDRRQRFDFGGQQVPFWVQEILEEELNKPSAIISYPGELTEEQAEELKQKFLKANEEAGVLLQVEGETVGHWTPSRTHWDFEHMGGVVQYVTYCVALDGESYAESSNPREIAWLYNKVEAEFPDKEVKAQKYVTYTVTNRWEEWDRETRWDSRTRQWVKLHDPRT